MKVSIVTICYNSEKTIKDTIKSVVKQNYDQIEYILVDGLSKDNTLNIIKEYAVKYPFIRFVSEKDEGLYDAMNKGVKMATGDLIGILNSDDFYKDEHVIKNYVEEYNKSKYDLAYSNIVIVDQSNTENIKRLWKTGYGKVKNGWLPPHPSVFVTRSVYDQLGLFDLSLKSVADTDFLIRVLSNKEVKSTYIDIVSVVMRDGGASNQGLESRKHHLINDAEAYRKNGYKFAKFIALKKQIRKIPQLLFKK
ncbi:MAG: glycosyltransferase [Haloplasmataceae bacterium]|jgi:glycosyltransferase involved in cell wall biosynthesis|nr:glycosyltransferase [Haloplasmataceae bacterium]